MLKYIEVSRSVIVSPDRLHHTEEPGRRRYKQRFLWCSPNSTKPCRRGILRRGCRIGCHQYSSWCQLHTDHWRSGLISNSIKCKTLPSILCFKYYEVIMTSTFGITSLQAVLNLAVLLRSPSCSDLDGLFSFISMGEDKLLLGRNSHKIGYRSKRLL